MPMLPSNQFLERIDYSVMMMSASSQRLVTTAKPSCALDA